MKHARPWAGIHSHNRGCVCNSTQYEELAW